MLVTQRKRVSARREIAKWLRKGNKSSERIFQVCLWYRRLSLYREGLRVLLRYANSELAKDYRVQLWIADFFNSLGANHFAKVFLERIKTDISETIDLDLAAGIYLGIGENQSAEVLFRRTLDSSKDRQNHFYFMAKLGYSDSLCRLDRLKDALSEAQFVLKNAPFELVKSIAKSAMGEYLARAGRFAEACDILATAEQEFSRTDQSYDRALVLKWLGYSYLRLGKNKIGLKHFNKAMAIVLELDMGLDQWIEFMDLLNRVGMLESEVHKRTEVLQSAVYGRPFTMGNVVFGKPTAKFKVFLDSKEFTFKANHSSVLPKELELLALLRLCQEQGLSFEIVKGRLWPDEALSYFYLDQRIYLLLNRLRHHYHIKVSAKKKKLYLFSSDWRKVAVHFSQDLRPRFLKNRTEFSSQEVSNFYRIQQNQRANYLKSWIARGWINKVGRGQYTVKRLVTSA